MAKIRLAILNDYEIVVRGLASLLEADDDFEIVDLSVDGSVEDPVDLALYDTFGTVASNFDTVREIVADPHVARIAVFTWNFELDHVDELLGLGVDGYLSKALTAEGLADALRRVADGERVVSDPPRRAAAGSADGRRWPGQGMDLTEKEADVLSLIVRGLDNQAIAEQLFISGNTLKTRIRYLYRKLDVDNRVQAALWGVKHGFEPDNEIRWEDLRWKR